MYKQVIIIRRDLGMSIGKIVAQACHASLGAFKKARKPKIRRWEQEGEKKVIVGVNSKEEMIHLYEKAKKEKIPCFLVEDAGLTELEPGTMTALGIGPDEEEKIDRITGNLSLL